MSISVIVPVWNGRELLARLLDSLDAQTMPPAEILAIDNGSSDGAPEMTRSRGARVIPMGRNMGFAAAVNRGVAEAKGDWLAVLNSDVELAPDYFEKLSASGALFATGKILSPSGLLDGAFDLTVRGGVTWRAGSGMPDAPPFDAPRDIASPPFTAVLFRPEVFRRVGGLDERFESYLEDADFGLRCAARGIAGRYVPEARAIHVGSAAMGRWHPQVVRLISRNQLFLAARHCRARDTWRVIVAQALWGGVALRHGRGLAWLGGKWDGLRRFAALRRELPLTNPDVLGQFLQDNERLIRQTNSEFYWRMYFMLTDEAQ
jgi:GT2 family glycosyltransferase